jgi:DNA replication protein DnaC
MAKKKENGILKKKINQILVNMKIGNIIEKGEYKDTILHSRKFKSTCTAEYFRENFIREAKNRMHGNIFLVDDENKEAINQLYYYLIGSDQFKGDLFKGIILMGAIGSGKTVLLESFIEVFNATSDKVITSIHAKDLTRIVKENPIGFLNKRPLFIDDMGKEQRAIKNYGTEEHPMEDIFNERYKNFALTFATTNYNFDDLQYSRHMVDRLKQMMNVIILPGKSRRD